MKIQDRYNSIDQSKLPKELQNILQSMKKKSKNFLDKKVNSIFEPQLNRIVKGLKDRYSESIKGEKVISKSSKKSINFPKNKPLLEDGGKLDDVSEAIYYANVKNKKIRTSFGDKTLIGLRSMISNDNYSPKEITDAIFDELVKSGRIPTGYGSKTKEGLFQMIKLARYEKGGKLKGRKKFTALQTTESLVDEYLKKQKAQNALFQLATKPYKDVKFPSGVEMKSKTHKTQLL